MRKRLFVSAILAVAMLAAVPSFAAAATQAKTKTKLSVSLSSAEETYAEKPVVSGVLKTSKGKAVKGQRVALYLEGEKVASKKTDSKGRVRFTAELPDDVDAGEWRLVYGGSATYGTSRSAAKITEKMIHAYLTLDLEESGVDDEGNAYDLYVASVELNEGVLYGFEFDGEAFVKVGYEWDPELMDESDGYVEGFEFDASEDGQYQVYLYVKSPGAPGEDSGEVLEDSAVEAVEDSVDEEDPDGDVLEDEVDESTGFDLIVW